MFINDLLYERKFSDRARCIGYEIYHSFANADDIAVFAPTIPDAQHINDICAKYSTYGKSHLVLIKVNA